MRRRYGAAAVAAFGIPFVAYVASLSSSPAFWDIGEMQTVPYILGIAHPPGFPAFVLLGYVFSHLVVVGSIAWRMNLFAALAMLTAAVALYVVVVEETRKPALGVAAAWLFAFGEVAWTRGTRADVHALAIAFEAVSFACAQRWVTHGSMRALVVSALAYGLALATHPVALWMLPGLVAYVLTGRRIDLRSAGTVVVASIAPLLLYLYLPVRSAQLFAARVDPTLALGLPPGRPFWDYGHPSSWSAFWWMISGAQFPRDGALVALVSPRALAHAAVAFAHAGVAEAGWLGVALAVVGAIVLAMRAPARAAAWIVVALLVVPFAFAYTIEADKLRYLLLPFWMTALFAAIGANVVLRMRGGAALLVAFAAAVLFWTNRGTLEWRHDVRGEAFVARVIRTTPRNAVIVAPWVYATPLAYAAYVERRLGGRTLVAADITPDIVSSFASWSRTRPIDLITEKPMPPIGGATFATIGSGFPLVQAVDIPSARARAVPGR